MNWYQAHWISLSWLISQVGCHIIALTISLRVRALHLTICSETYISFLLILADKDLHSKTQLSSYPVFIMLLKLLNRVTCLNFQVWYQHGRLWLGFLVQGPVAFVYSQYLIEILFLLLNFGIELVKVHWSWVACGGHHFCSLKFAWEGRR